MPDITSQPFPPDQLNTTSVLRAYRDGFFPMACGDRRLRWFSPDPRGVLPLDKLRIPHGFRRELPRLGFRVSVNAAFMEVVSGCADRAETWIDASIARVYADLHAGGSAHSVEVWSEETLVGGLYGVQIGGAFFGESMFSRVSGASKLALVALVEILRDCGFLLLDIQWVTAHLEMFGATEVARTAYLRMLKNAMTVECVFKPHDKTHPSLQQSRRNLGHTTICRGRDK